MRKKLNGYILKGFYQWAIDNGLTPVLQVEEHDNKTLNKSIFLNGMANFNIDPQVIENVKFTVNFLKFKTTVNGMVKWVKIYYDFILQIFTQEEQEAIAFVDGGFKYSINESVKSSRVCQNAGFTLVKI